jgi:hypothetical protein
VLENKQSGNNRLSSAVFPLATMRNRGNAAAKIIMYYCNVNIAKGLQKNSTDGGHSWFLQVYGYVLVTKNLTFCWWTF